LFSKLQLESGIYSISGIPKCSTYQEELQQTITFSVATPCTPFVIDIGQNYKLVNPEAGLTIVANIIDCRQSSSSKAYKVQFFLIIARAIDT